MAPELRYHAALTDAPLKLLVLMPVYEDWASAAEVCRRMDACIGEVDAAVEVVWINDGSQTDPRPAVRELRLRHIGRISVLQLRRNLGHQRAIAIGLAYAATNLSAAALVIMDADGEDPPEQIPTLVREAVRLQLSSIVFAAGQTRGRLEIPGVLFRLSHGASPVHWARYRNRKFQRNAVESACGNRCSSGNLESLRRSSPAVATAARYDSP